MLKSFTDNWSESRRIVSLDITNAAFTEEASPDKNIKNFYSLYYTCTTSCSTQNLYFREDTPRRISSSDTFGVIHRRSTIPRATEIASAIVTPAYSSTPKRSFGPNAIRGCKSAKCVAYRYHPLHMRIRSAKKSQLCTIFPALITWHILQIRDGLWCRFFLLFAIFSLHTELLI